MSSNAGPFPDRFVLGEGFPWALGMGKSYQSVSMCVRRCGEVWFTGLDWDNVFWSPDCPRYRLVLERIEPNAPNQTRSEAE